jgi:hypothetical protein
MATNEYAGMTCGDFLNAQRAALSRIDDLSARGVKERSMELLANIYAVSYQMTFERIEPPGLERGPAQNEPLDVELVRGISEKMRRAPELQYLVDDPWRLSQAIYSARQGNGYPLIELVNVAHLARTGQEKAPKRAAEPERAAGAPTL